MTMHNVPPLRTSRGLPDSAPSTVQYEYKLAQRIVDLWIDAGYDDVEVEVLETRTPSGSVLFCIRSNLVNGLPPSLVEVA